jgi:hypothetical protein
MLGRGVYCRLRAMGTAGSRRWAAAGLAAIALGAAALLPPTTSARDGEENIEISIDEGGTVTVVGEDGATVVVDEGTTVTVGDATVTVRGDTVAVEQGSGSAVRIDRGGRGNSVVVASSSGRKSSAHVHVSSSSSVSSGSSGSSSVSSVSIGSGSRSVTVVSRDGETKITVDE